MERRIEQDVDGWPTRPFDDGYDGLRQLASADFSGVVRADGAWLFFVNGKIVGIFEGDLDDVEGSQGSAHKAPHPSLPLLYAMQATGGDTRAKYYTNDTSISEVDDTLSSGSFTGYVELSENVLSGDYYQLYHGGSSMSVAFVGNSGKMVTGEDAFERADDEVGIYEVVDVDVEVADVPEPDGSDVAAGTAATAAAESGPEEDESEADVEPEAIEADAAGSSDEHAATEATAAAPADGDSDSGATDEQSRGNGRSDASSDDDVSESTDGATATAVPPATSEADERSDPDARPAGDGASANDPGGDVAAGDSPTATATPAEGSPPPRRDADATSPAAESPDESPATESPDESASDEPPSPASSATDGAGSAAAEFESTPETGTEPRQTEAAWREVTTVPSLDPDHSEEGEPATEAPEQTDGRDARSAKQSRAQSQKRSQGQSQRQSRPTSERRQSTGEQSGRHRSGDVDDTLEQEVLEREDRIDRLQQRAENLEDERDDVAGERDQLQERVDSLSEENESLRSEIRELEQEIEELEATPASAAPSAGGSVGDGTGGEMAPRAALEATDLFVRYDSKSAPTLAAAHDGDADATTVNENLRLDVHTQFEDEGATVDDEPFEAFLQETMAYRFVEWLVRTLPYEIRETDSAGALRDLYDALPEIDRVEFHGAVTRDAVEDEEGAPSETFDVVVRDKMGEALLVANMNEERDPATDRMIVDLQEGASRVKEHSAALAGAFFVTRSFFEPAALETASEATSGSLLSRDSRASYVKLSRKQGYHLCLVEARGDDLHLNVPEL